MQAESYPTQLDQLKTSKEKFRKFIAMLISAVIWLALVLSIFGVLYGAAIGLFVLFAHALFITWVRMNGVQVTEEQLPELYERAKRASETLGMDKVPEIYIIQAGGMLNAFATKFFSRRLIVIYSDLLDATEEHPEQADFIIGHELGHLALGHLQSAFFLAPAHLVPWLGTALSRAYEYSCDRCGLATSGDIDASTRALAVLAAGGKLGQKISVEQFARQSHDAGRFWATVLELSSTHPFLPKRLNALKAFAAGQEPRAASRNIFGVLLAPILGGPAGGAAAAAAPLMMIVAVAGILAAIAIPNFVRFQAKAKQAEAEALLNTVYHEQQRYFAEHGTYTNIEKLDLVETGQHYTIYMGAGQKFGEDLGLDASRLGFLSKNEFAAIAIGNIDDDDAYDIWQIDNEGNIEHLQDDVTVKQ